MSRETGGEGKKGEVDYQKKTGSGPEGGLAVQKGI